MYYRICSCKRMVSKIGIKMAQTPKYFHHQVVHISMLDRHSFPLTWSDRQSSIHRGTFFTNRFSLAAFRKESCQRLDFDFLQYNHSHKICVDFLDSKSNWDGRRLLGNVGQHLDCGSLYTLHFYLLLLTRYQNLP